MEDTAAYRARILEALRQAQDNEGKPKLTEEQAIKLSQELSDTELEEGMPFITLEEVVELLLESGLE